MVCILQCVKIFVQKGSVQTSSCPRDMFMLSLMDENLGSMAWRVGATHLLILLPRRIRQVLIAWVRRRITRRGTDM